MPSRAELEKTKHRLRQLETHRRSSAWRKFRELHGTGKLTEVEFHRMFSHAYWTGALDVLNLDVRGSKRNGLEIVPRIDPSDPLPSADA